MTHYCENPTMCRVDFFKPSGKWYDSDAICFEGLYDEPLIHDAFRKALANAGLLNRVGFTAVCLEPYHKYAHPIMLRITERTEL
jgi:hypothetical protein